MISAHNIELLYERVLRYNHDVKGMVSYFKEDLVHPTEASAFVNDIEPYIQLKRKNKTSNYVRKMINYARRMRRNSCI